jgi:NADH:ubiquinone oxidoreductase subunit 4 (subunit M)
MLKITKSGDERGDFYAWLGMLGPPTLWLINFQIIYARVMPACASGTKIGLLISSIVFLALIVGCGVLAFGELGAAGARTFMAQVGLMTTGLFILVTIAQTIATLLMDACLT